MYRVIDMSRLLPGPYATLCLAGLGMEIIKIEEPGGGDYLRSFPPIQDGAGVWFNALNRGKKSVTLDLKTGQDRQRLLRLLGSADVLVESFRPGVMARLGLDPVELQRRFPSLVIASLTGWGQTGPWRDLPGHDLGFMALAGLLDDRRVPRLQWADLAAGGLQAALRITGALLQRTQTGAGAWLDIAMLDGLLSLQQARFANLAAGAPPDTLLTGETPCYDLYRCADGRWISLAALEPRFLAPLTEAAGPPARENLTAFFASEPRDAWVERLGNACVVPVLDLEEVAGHPQVAARALFDRGLPHPPTGPVTGRAPMLGEHNSILEG